MKFLLVGINAKYIHSNLGLYSLKSNCDENREHIFISEYTINHYVDDIIIKIYKQKPDVIGFSCYIWNIHMVNEIVQELKKVLPQVDIWLGGPEVSYNATQYLEQHKEVKGIIIGEGEETYKELLASYINEEKDHVNTIQGIVFRTQDGRILENGIRKLMDFHNSIMPYIMDDRIMQNRGIHIQELENRIIYYESSRGCPYSCSYCLSSREEKVRFKSLDIVYKELQFFLEARVKQVKFVDRTFNCNIERANSIWEYIKLNDNIITNFHFEIGGDLLNEKALDILKDVRAGQFQFEIGVQTTNEDTIHEISRKMNINKLKHAVRRIKSTDNIHLHLDLIIGLPYEDLECFKQSFNTVYNMKPHQLQVGFLKVLKGTSIHDMADQYNIIYKEQAPYEVMSTRWLSYDEIILLKGVEQMVEIYYNSMQYINTMEYLMKFVKTPFDFYEELSQFYHKKNFQSNHHSRIAKYNLLLEFIQKKGYGNIEVLLEIMTFDIYLRENAKSRPEFAKENKHIKEIVRKILKTNLTKGNHIEEFIFNIEKAIQTGQAVEELHYILFDYSQRDLISGNAYTKKYLANEVLYD